MSNTSKIAKFSGNSLMKKRERKRKLKKSLANGNVGSFMGVRFIVTDELNKKKFI